METITLNNGVDMPALELGVFQTPRTRPAPPSKRHSAPGTHHVDTAAAYGNERQVGEEPCTTRTWTGPRSSWTKIWISDYGYDETLHGFEKSAGKLGVDQVDLLI